MGGRLRTFAVCLTAVALLVGAGCGDDDDDEDTSGSGSGTEETTEGSEGGGGGEPDLAAACAANTEASMLFSSPELPPAEDANPVLDELEATAPEEIAEPLAVILDAGRQALNSGDTAAFETPEVGMAISEADGYFFDNCDGEQVELTGIDYAFEGAPATVPAGPVNFRLSNEGMEFHEVAIARKNDDTTQSFSEILELPEEEALALVTPVGAGFAMPGDKGVAFTDLEAGEYAMVCFIPQGIVSPESEPTGPPHFVLGMVSEFTVE